MTHTDPDQRWASAPPTPPPGHFITPDAPPCQERTTIGNDVSRLNDRLNHVTGNLEIVLNRLRGTLPSAPKCGNPEVNVSLRDRLVTANESADFAGKQVQEILSLLGE